MKVFLAGTSSRENLFQSNTPLYVLESYYYMQEWQLKSLKKWDIFLLDSGAFTFMNNFKGKVNWQEYINNYANFIIKNDIKYFFELDIDTVVGYNKVKEYTKYLENKVGRKCIPVWHKSRGLEEWKRITKEYNYVAIGGIVIKEIKPKDYDIFIPLLKIAKENNCKVHGLGFTNLKGMKKYHFYSVDSTNWLSSSRFGNIEYFNGKEMVKYSKPTGKKPIHYTIRDDFVVKEWIKFQKYADKYL